MTHAVTGKELESIYGTAPTETEIAMAIGKAASDFDADDLGEVCSSLFEEIAEAIAAGNLMMVGCLVNAGRQVRIANIASSSIYGKQGKINAMEVKV